MIGRTLDRYILGQWTRIFVLTALGFPLVAIVIDLTDFLDKWLSRGMTAGEIALAYFFSIPENMFTVMPAAVLFATVFTVGALNRNSELTAAKAGGMSFYRVVRPLFLASALASLLALMVGELSPGATTRRLELQKSKDTRSTSGRYNFVYRAEEGWVYTIGSLDVARRQLRQLVLERAGQSLEYPALAVTADSATWDTTAGRWNLWGGASRIVAGSDRQATFLFDHMRLRVMQEAPADLLIEPKRPEEMRYAELGRYIQALVRSGNNVDNLRVEQALKLALPVACLIIALFAAPLAVTAPRSGTAMGIAVSLGTTVAYLLMAQIAKAAGAGSVVNPVAAAWIPNALFLTAGLVLLARVRT